jgi:hypothetical protein
MVVTETECALVLPGAQAAPVPGSMFLFLVAWTSTVMRCSGADAQQQQSEQATCPVLLPTHGCALDSHSDTLVLPPADLSADLLSDIEQEGAGA